MPENNECVCCGRIIPEGTMICLQCGYNDDMQTFRPKIVTNGDRIRAMDDKQLSEYLETLERRAMFTDSVTSSSDWLKWLKKEAEP